MTKPELIEALNKLRGMSDIEVAHLDADALLLQFINDEDIQRAYAEVPKWYA